MTNARAIKSDIVETIYKHLFDDGVGLEVLPLDWSTRAVPVIVVKVRNAGGLFDYYEVKVTGPKL